jgi:hypothetical protein
MNGFGEIAKGIPIRQDNTLEEIEEEAGKHERKDCTDGGKRQTW